jgi:hypothetical protein
MRKIHKEVPWRRIAPLSTGFPSLIAFLVLGTIVVALLAFRTSTIQQFLVRPAPAIDHSPEAFAWATLPVQRWTRLPTTGAAPRKVFHGAATLAPDRHEIFFFGDDTHSKDYDNGVFWLDLRSLRWSRDYEADPTTAYTLTPEGYAITTSGRPWAMHTFDAWDYDPERNVFLHFEKSRDSHGRLAAWAFRYQ